MKIVESKISVLLVTVCVVASSALQAQVPVVESTNRLGVAQRTAPPPLALDSKSEMFYQLQMLQQEVRELRGILEEQTYELKRLKQQRLDDYVSFDRRLGALQANPAQAGSASEAPAMAGSALEGAGDSSSTAPPLTAASNSVTDQEDEVQRYRTAIDLVLRKKDYAAAIIAFQQYLNEYPQGSYAANSQYWLGEIYLLQNDLEQARQWFGRLLSEHAGHAKAPDATYKLGTVYHKLGDSAKARQLLQQVAQGDTNAARLAAAYLADMAK